MPLSLTLTTWRNLRGQVERGIRLTEGVQITIVPPTFRPKPMPFRARSRRALRPAPPFDSAPAHEIAQGSFLQQRNDQQDRIGSMRGGFNHGTRQRKIRAAPAQTPRRVRFQIRPGCRGKFAIRQNAERSSPSSRIHPSVGSRIEVLGEYSLLGDAFLISPMTDGGCAVRALEIAMVCCGFAFELSAGEDRASSARLCSTIRARISGTARTILSDRGEPSW